MDPTALSDKKGSIGGVGGGKKIGEQVGTLVELGGGSDEFGGVEDCVEGVGLGLGVGEEEEEEEEGSCWVGGQHDGIDWMMDRLDRLFLFLLKKVAR